MAIPAPLPIPTTRFRNILFFVRAGLAPAVFLWILLGGALLLRAAEPVETVVEGVEGEALENVKKSLALPYGLVRDGKVDTQWLERFAGQAQERVRSALEPFGYYRARITTSLVETPEGNYRLKADIDPGPPVIVSSVQVTLAGAGSANKTLTGLAGQFPLHTGDLLVQPNYEEAKGVLRSKALALGYLDAAFSTHEIRISPDRTKADIRLVLDTGTLYRFGEVTITGAPGYPDEFLRRYVTIKQGRPFSYARLGETQLNFTNTERFAEVIVTPDREHAHDHQVPVTITLKPGHTQRLQPGIGYGTDTGARGSLTYRHLNVLGLGHEFQSQLYLSERLQGIAANYVIPSPRDTRTFSALQLNLQKEDVSAYVSRLAALEGSVNRSMGRGKLGTLFLRVHQEGFTIAGEDSSSLLVLPGIRYSEHRFDNLVRPTKGYRFMVEGSGTHQLLGSDTGLIQVRAEGSAIVPLPWRLSLLSRVAGGLTFLNDPLADLPASLRFFAGGDRSVRGYSYKSLGPRNASGEVTGGRNLLEGSIELQRALFTNWGVSLFYDAGNAFNDLANIRLYQGAGFGIHYYTLVGAINLYVARQIGVDSPAFRIHLTIGFEL
ncbi:autotransporter assembly complex protein TamA [Geobacter hydrogenophilus]|uniref:Translocation and assembly module subunit TamA n=1 Tax=Geobacter hydrogenophilus TaxID=40983 RepID=A0A9W6LBX3_9BACT|nr:autotransporter assembly complex family protein [Geobacter hydrogenophilus]MBT0895572.1 autotransporter assembly complex protein TamA [Geobacter hydrogenophilus]GLI37304.1 outer membrane protein assembly factor [Geobacter hydrogenophilus]